MPNVSPTSWVFSFLFAACQPRLIVNSRTCLPSWLQTFGSCPGAADCTCMQQPPSHLQSLLGQKQAQVSAERAWIQRAREWRRERPTFLHPRIKRPFYMLISVMNILALHSHPSIRLRETEAFLDISVSRLLLLLNIPVFPRLRLLLLRRPQLMHPSPPISVTLGGERTHNHHLFHSASSQKPSFSSQIPNVLKAAQWAADFQGLLSDWHSIWSTNTSIDVNY